MKNRLNKSVLLSPEAAGQVFLFIVSTPVVVVQNQIVDIDMYYVYTWIEPNKKMRCFPSRLLLKYQ